MRNWDWTITRGGNGRAPSRLPGHQGLRLLARWAGPLKKDFWRDFAGGEEESASSSHETHRPLSLARIELPRLILKTYPGTTLSSWDGKPGSVPSEKA